MCVDVGQPAGEKLRLGGWWVATARDATDRLAMLVCPVLVRFRSLGRRGAALGAIARLTPVQSCLQWRARSRPAAGRWTDPLVGE
ncbi:MULTISPECIES: hypothetical protein [unclassified Haloarcula]|uniref:hypothetical protein n=1 Tax=unclassified Haloarcula TaxID=2624677 RepID=UPI001243F704|nr:MULTISPECIES: hypothetical protein [unclassified Haloarcula]